jgi:LuxR family maltose regulon positive regulatory protein
MGDASNRARGKTMGTKLRTLLSQAQLEVLHLVNLGHANREIADQLAITVGTTKWHLYQIFRKLDVKNRTAAAARARQLGLL